MKENGDYQSTEFQDVPASGTGQSERVAGPDSEESEIGGFDPSSGRHHEGRDEVHCDLDDNQDGRH